MKEINLKIRMQVLENALTIENGINEVFLRLFNLKATDTKSFGYKSTTLSFKHKITLLKDIGVIDDNAFYPLNLFMEFRNQFMHNIYANSYSFVVNTLNRKKELLKFDDKELSNEMRKDEEMIYRFCFYSLDLLRKSY